MEKGGKSRNLALKGMEEEIEDFEGEDDDKDKPPRKSKSSRKGKNEKPLI